MPLLANNRCAGLTRRLQMTKISLVFIEKIRKSFSRLWKKLGMIFFFFFSNEKPFVGDNFQNIICLWMKIYRQQMQTGNSIYCHFLNKSNVGTLYIHTAKRCTVPCRTFVTHFWPFSHPQMKHFFGSYIANYAFRF